MLSPSLTLLRTQSDERLVSLARDGHERAFEAIVERYRRPLLRAARRVLPEGRADDALQQALLSAWAALGRGDAVRELRPWLFQIVHNTALNALRVRGYDYEELDAVLRIAGADADEDELERRAVARQTLASLAALPDRQREALLRTAVSGYSQEEVARDLGISENAVRQLVHRARVNVRAAATALTPLPLVTAVASGERAGPFVERIAELAAGAAPASAALTAAKTGTAVVLAGGALSGPALVDRAADRPQREAPAAVTAPPMSRGERPSPARSTRSGPPSTSAPTAVRAPSARRPAALRVSTPRVRTRGQDRRSNRGPRDGAESEDERSGSHDPGDDRDDLGDRGRGRDEEDHDRSGGDSPVEPESEHSGPRRAEDDEPQTSGASGHDLLASSGPGSGGEPDEVEVLREPEPAETPEPVELDSSGSGSGSGSSGSGEDPS